MDSDVTADSLSPYATGDDVSISEPSGFGVGLLSSFPTQADPDPTRHDLATAVDGRHGHGGIRNTPSVDSFGLSPVSDAPLLFSADHENFGGTASSAKRGGGAGTQMGSSLEDSASQRQRLGNNTASNDDRDPNFSRGSLSRKGSIPHSGINTASDHVSTTTRKRPREVAAIDGFTVRASTTGRRPQPQNHPRLQSSWPFDRAVAAARDGLLALEESWDDNAPLNSPLSTPDRRPSRSNVADARDFRHHISRSKGIPPATHEDKGDLDSFSQRHERGGTQDHGYDEGATQSANGAGSDISDVGGHYSTGEFSSREGIGDNRRRWNGGLDLLDTLSVSDVSSGGVPPPPVIPAGSLPAIGTLREVSFIRVGAIYPSIAGIVVEENEPCSSDDCSSCVCWF